MIALFNRNSLASLFEDAIPLFIIIFIIVSFEEVNVGIPLNTVSISSSVKSFTLPVNRHSVSLIASCSSSSPCKNLTTSLASAFWASLFSGCVFVISSNLSISSWDKKVNTFRYSTTFESSVFTRYWYIS